MSTYDHNPDRNRDRFYALAAKLDKILLRYKHNIYIVNNPNLHLSRNHPEYLENWKCYIYKNTISSADIFTALKRILKIIFVNTLIIIREILLNKKFPKSTPKHQDKIDYLFVSHFLGTPLLDEDFYYGGVISTLASQKNSVVRLLIPQTRLDSKFLNLSSYPSYFLNSFLPNKQIINYVFSNYLAIIKLLLFCVKENYSLYEILVILYGQFENFSNIKISYNVEEAIIRFNPKNLIMTYEGNAIERSIFFLCFKHRIFSTGYQHAPIIKDQYSIFRTLGKELNPRLILTTGNYTKKKFDECLENIIPSVVLGSPKSFDGQASTKSRGQKSDILLIPDGNQNSVKLFFEIGVFLANTVLSRNITIRAHPLFMSKLNEISNKDPKTVSSRLNISSNPLDADLSSSHFVVYQNSSVSIKALLAGCEVIHFCHPLADIDPLFDLGELHFSVRSKDEILALVQNYHSRSNETTSILLNFARNYFSTIDLKIFNHT